MSILDPPTALARTQLALIESVVDLTAERDAALAENRRLTAELHDAKARLRVLDGRAERVAQANWGTWREARAKDWLTPDEPT
jgi:hypothetical protein